MRRSTFSSVRNGRDADWGPSPFGFWPDSSSRQRGHHRLTIDPSADNARAIASYSKVGFKSIGVMRQYERQADGTWHDGLLMDLLHDELPASLD